MTAKSAKSRAAFRLHKGARMLRFLPVVALLAGSAHAQSSMSQGGSCTSAGMAGGAIKGNVGLAATDANGDYQGIAPNFLGSVFGAAECECSTNDIVMRIQLTGQYPVGTATGKVEVWVGSGCEDPNRRNNPQLQNVCERIDAPIDFNRFVSGACPGCGMYIDIPLPARALFSPVAHVCSTAGGTNSAYVLIFSAQDSLNHSAACTVSLPTSGAPPSPPTNANATGGDSAVSITWEPTIGGNPIDYYQVLCADEAGNPIPGLFSDSYLQAYSWCDGTTIFRRPFQAANAPPVVGDGGTATGDMSVRSTPTPLWPTQATGDMGTADLAGADLAPAGDMATLSGFNGSFDPKFICSDRITVSNISYNLRISGLENGKKYQFFVLTVNKYGNFSGSGPLVATATATQDLWERIRDDGADPSGFCTVAGPGAHLWIVEGGCAAAILAILVLRRLRRRR
jgi:hypothetical protein